jgi:hypothetical protein
VRKCSRNISSSVFWCCCILLITEPVENWISLQAEQPPLTGTLSIRSRIISVGFFIANSFPQAKTDCQPSSIQPYLLPLFLLFDRSSARFHLSRFDEPDLTKIDLMSGRPKFASRSGEV